MTQDEQQACRWSECDRQLATHTAELAHIREVFGLQTKLTERALELQAKEYERRMENLNNENGRILAAQSASVNLDVWRVEHKALEQRIEWLRNMVYMAGGGLMVIEFLIRYLGK